MTNTEVGIRINKLKEIYCPKAVIELKFQDHDEYLKIEAQVSLEYWESNKFEVSIYPSFFGLENDFVLRHEIMHIKDVMDPDFVYDGNLQEFDGLDKYQNLYNTIWEITIDMRLEKEGHKPVIDFAERLLGYLDRHWPGYQDRFPLSLSAIKELAKNPTCQKIKQIGKDAIEKLEEIL